jgi:hypothetical protein
LRIDDAKRAVEMYQEGLKKYPDEIDLHYDMALVCRMSNQREIMLEHCQKYLKLLNSQKVSTIFRMNTGKDKINNIVKWIKTKKCIVRSGSQDDLESIKRIVLEHGLDIGMDVEFIKTDSDKKIIEMIVNKKVHYRFGIDKAFEAVPSILDFAGYKINNQNIKEL